jgi:nitrite reductase (NAD(P)H)
VLRIDTEKKTVHTSKDNTFHYDILVLATGSAAGLPPYVSAAQAKDTKGESSRWELKRKLTSGIFVYRNIADLEGLIKYAERPEIKTASVVGGGVSVPSC